LNVSINAAVFFCSATKTTTLIYQSHP